MPSFGRKRLGLASAARQAGEGHTSIDSWWGGGKASQARSDSAGASTAIGPVSRTGGKWAAKRQAKSISTSTRSAGRHTLHSVFE